MPTILLTGGTGYIGSHTCVELIEAGYETILFDNLCNSSPIVVDRIEKITGTRPVFVQGDIRDRGTLDRLFGERSIDAVIHFAGLKAVGESMMKPLAYYINNVGGSTTLFDAMQSHGVRRIVFSSSATVYDPNAEMPLKETSPLGPANPYGHTKLMVERILDDLAEADPEWKATCLRYFNPVGAHESGLIGEDPRNTPENLMPYIAQVAVGRLPVLRVFGNDYPTPDGTGIRDYIHVMDLASAHVAALERLFDDKRFDQMAINVGTGGGYSVLDMISAFRQVSGKAVPFEMVARRAGDSAVSFADVEVARRALGWRHRRDLEQMCVDAWRWQSVNPRGYDQ
jgi:UDP-glucose 4-epimerase